MSPLTAMISAPILSASERIVSLSTITPRSWMSKPLQLSTMPVMFFPMSWTSPLTVAMTIFGLVDSVVSAAESIYGWRISTASLMTLADLTTCGRNILPSPKSFPTASIPSIRGPSMIFTALPYSFIASSRSCFRVSVRPFIRAVFRRVGRSPIGWGMTLG